MLKFEKITENIYRLKAPFGSIWSGVTLVTGKENVLIDSDANDESVDAYILPALRELGCAPSDITWLTQTHCHGDHMGGHARIAETCPSIRIAAFEAAVPKLADPVEAYRLGYTRFPAFDPVAPTTLRAVRCDKVLSDGEFLTEDLRVWHTAGHDSDCVCWQDVRTNTFICGDSVQGNGTSMQGIAFYKYGAEYIASMQKLKALAPECLVFGHEYDGIGSVVSGKEQVQNALTFCMECSERYDAFVKAHKTESPDKIAEELIRAHGCGMPPKLFMSMYTVSEHLK